MAAFGLSLNPIAFWQMDETTGLDMIDASPNGNDGTYLSQVSLGLPALSPYSVRSVAYDGTQTKNVSQAAGSINDFVLGNGDVRAWECWLRADANTSQTDFTAIMCRGHESNNFGFVIHNNTIKFVYGNNIGVYALDSGITPVSGSVYHLIAQIRTGEVEFYVNLNLEGSDTTTFDNGGSGNDIFIGGVSGTVNPALSCLAIDMCAIYPQWLSAADRLELNSKILRATEGMSAGDANDDGTREVLTLFSDGALFGASESVFFVNQIAEGLALAEVLTRSKHKSLYGEEGLRLGESAFRAAEHAVIEGLLAGESVSMDRHSLLAAIEALGLSDIVVGTREATLLTAAGLVLADDVVSGRGIAAADGIVFGEAQVSNVHRIASILEGLLFGEIQDSTIVITALIREGLDLGDDSSMSAWIRMLVEEGVRLSALASIRGQIYDCLVMSQDTEAVTEYDGYRFDSLVEIDDDIHLGAGENGLMWLEGDTDDGAFIPAVYRSGVWRAADGLKATLNEAFLLMSGDGRAWLRTITDDGKQRTYRLKPVLDGRPRTRRVELGQGVESVTWQLELELIEGRQLDISDMMFHVAPLKRRI